jgi:hypothetical protein
MFNIKRKNIEIKEGGRYLVRNWDGSTSAITIVHIDEAKDLAIEMDDSGKVLKGSLSVLSHEIIKEIQKGGN